MADDTGGRVIDVHNEKSLEKAFDEISEELRSQYVLGYYPTNAEARRDIPQNQGERRASGHEDSGAQGILRAVQVTKVFVAAVQLCETASGPRRNIDRAPQCTATRLTAQSWFGCTNTAGIFPAYLPDGGAVGEVA